MTESEKILTYQELENAFKMQYNEDIATLPKNSNRQFKPNPVISDKPDFCLIALEPSLPEMGDKTTKVNYIDLLFMQSYNNLILQYCAYTYLCQNKFNYQITDICKTPLTQKEHTFRKAIYPKWNELLRKELKYLNSPSIIAIGSKTKTYLEKMNINDFVFDIPHYSKNNTNSKIFNEISNQIGENYKEKAIMIIEEIREFTNNILIPHIKSSNSTFTGNVVDIYSDTINQLFDLEKSKAQKRPVTRYLAYEKIFNEIIQK